MFEVEAVAEFEVEAVAEAVNDAGVIVSDDGEAEAGVDDETVEPLVVGAETLPFVNC